MTFFFQTKKSRFFQKLIMIFMAVGKEKGRNVGGKGQRADVEGQGPRARG